MLTILTYRNYWLLNCLIIITRPKLKIFKNSRDYLAWESILTVIIVFSLNTDLHVICTDLYINTQMLLLLCWLYETVMISETWFRPTSMPKCFAGPYPVRMEYCSVYAMLSLAWEHSRPIKLKLFWTERLFADKLCLQVGMQVEQNIAFLSFSHPFSLISLPLPL